MDGETERPGPIFVVGCSRSGTTLLQSIIGQHEGVAAFPESNVLYHCLGDLDYRRYGLLKGRRKYLKYIFHKYINKMGLSSGYPRDQFLRFVDAIANPNLEAIIKHRAYLLRTIFNQFQMIMDASSGGLIWVEKSPQNIFCIEYIERYIPRARFVHIVRNGTDNVASLIDAASRYPSFARRFSGELGVQKAVNYWNSCVKISDARRHNSRHFVIRYEDLVASQSESLAPVADFLGLNFISDQFKYRLDGLTVPGEDWKEKGSTKIREQEEKFTKIFSEREQKTILAELLSVEEIFPRKLR